MLVKDGCNKAIEDIDETKLQIKVDSLDKDTFEKAKELVDICLKAEPPTKRQKRT